MKTCGGYDIIKEKPLRQRKEFIMELRNGIRIPEIGLGVYKLQAGAEMNTAVGAAYRLGYRLFDTAQMYGNEAGLGEALCENDIVRENVFLVSKVHNTNQWYEPTIESLHISLEKLQTTYLDAYLIHWPGQNRERTLSTWQAMEQAYRDGLTRSIGVCNFEISQLEFLLAHCTIPPMINQIEHTPLLHDPALLSFCREHGIQVVAWAPLLRGKFGEEIPKIAEKYQKTPAQLLLRWNLQQGIIPIPKSKNPARLAENFDVFDFSVSEEDMARLNAMNCGKRTSFDPLTFDFE